MIKGFWEKTEWGIKAEYFDNSEVTGEDYEYIYNMIKQGFNCGELIKEG